MPLLQKLERRFRIDITYFLSGGLWLITAQGLTIVASLISAVIFARLLSQTELGIYRYVISVGIFLSAFSLSGIGQAILQAGAKGHTVFFSYSTKPTILYGLGSSMTALIAALYYFYNGNHVLMVGCITIALLQPTSILFLNTLAYLYGQKHFKSGTYLQGIKSFIVAGASIATIYITRDITTLLIVYFATQAICGIGSYLWYRPHQANTEPLSVDIQKKYLAFAKHTSVQNIIVGLANRLDNIIVFQHLGAASLAYFTIATLLPDQIKGAFKNVLTLLIPKYAKHDTIDTLRGHIPKRSWQFFCILTLISIGVILITPPLYTLLFPMYPEAILYSQLLALSFPASIYLIPFSALQSQTKDRTLYHLHAYISVFQIIVTYTLILTSGLIGAIIARIVTQYFQCLVSFILVRR